MKRKTRTYHFRFLRSSFLRCRQFLKRENTMLEFPAKVFEIHGSDTFYCIFFSVKEKPVHLFRSTGCIRISELLN